MKDALRRNSEHLKEDVLWVPWTITTFHTTKNNTAHMTVKGCLDLSSDLSMQGDMDRLVQCLALWMT